jgi:CelD/BcsL family acetyltransferase involved in cellulose biosynthesis
MRYRLIAADELDEGLVRRWGAIQSTSRLYSSPFFRPEFTQAVGAVRSDLRICVLEDANRVVGFVPFHRSRLGIARPVGLGLSDHHGVIVETTADWNVRDLMDASGIVRWEFDHLLAGQAQRLSRVTSIEPSPTIDTTGSFDNYVDAKRKSLETVLRRQRKLERELGSCRLEISSLDDALLDKVIRWKGEQCHRTGAVNFFALNWTVELIRRIHSSRSSEFSGVLSVLWSGDELLSLHFGMRSREVLHYWFPVYNHSFRDYSPGLILLLSLVRNACENDTRHIDLGKDLTQYKTKFMTGAVMVAEGCETRPALVNTLFSVLQGLESLGRNSMLRPLLRVPGNLVRRIGQGRRFQ